MTRRSFLATAPAVLSAQSRQSRPNFVVICTDDHGYRDLGCQGATDLKTPNFDALAASGVRFTNWYSNCPLCAPSRASLMTGRYPERAGLVNNGTPLPLEQKTIASVLKEAGYKTGITGKWHLGNTPETVPNGRGFDYFYGFHSGCVDFYSHRYYWSEPRSVNYHDLWRNRTEIFEDGQYLTERITAEAVQFIGNSARDPFFLYVPYNAPHYPMHAPKKYMDRFQSLDPERRTYAAMLAAVDDGVGEIVQAIRRAGQLDNTMILFVADNGATTEARAGLNQKPATAGDNGVFKGFKFSLFDGGMHVPAILSWPGRVKPGQVNGEVAMTMDIMPTVAAAANVQIPSGYKLDGADILPVTAQGAKSPHDAIFWLRGPQSAVRRGRWKLVVNGIVYERTPESRKPLTGEDAVWLSDLEADPGEKTNLRRKHPEIVDQLSTLIAQWKAAMPPESITKP